MVEDLKISVDVTGTAAHVALVGELDDFNAAYFHAYFQDKPLPNSLKTMRVDVAGLSFMDSVGLGVLTTFLRDQRGVSVVLDAPQPQVHRLLGQSGLLDRGLFVLAGIPEKID